ncbi:hypothetical protein BV372_15720 [Nostoc sp. T09]|uniref:hypothetical protein n=1 Tax=Nostoc sp. T09 TaxID=1932621 RepID=UPI000A3D55F9|nr:hypothetical protein [Nostoc sp. T09]OUL33647.1 hypothetical protein BV372_15720 [Nostoc sp. T09]
MKDKQTSLEDIDFATELSMSELEAINGGAGVLTQEQSNDPQGRPTPSAPTGTREPLAEDSIITKYEYPTITI